MCSMNRSALLTFSGQLREARENALRDSEAFDGIIHVVERLGSVLCEQILDLKRYESKITDIANKSALASDIPSRWRNIHAPFSVLYKLVRVARNEAVHHGGFARRLTTHAIELSIMLEDALREHLDDSTVGDYMVRNPICAEMWHPISFIRQQMLANSFSFLPVKRDGEWFLVSDLEIATYLRNRTSERNQRLAKTLAASEISMPTAKYCPANSNLIDALNLLQGSETPLLVYREDGDRQHIIGIVTPFDLL